MTFDNREPGTLESQWSASPHWNTRRELDPSTIHRLIVVAAHPDDETLGAAGLMQRVARAGGDVRVVLATDGEGSHPQSPTHTTEQLRARRMAEVEEAIELIAPGSSVVRLGLRDGALKHDASQLRAGIEAVIADGSGAATLAVTWRGDGHGDHRTVGEVSAEVAHATGSQLLEYPIWLWHWSSPDDTRMPWSQLRTLVLDPEEKELKLRAIAMHTSQTEPLSNGIGDEVVLRDEFLEHFRRPLEAYVSHEIAPDGASLSREYFDTFYADKTDPWGFETRWYEQRKRALTLAALPRERFERALEVGCSIGVLTAQLAARCDQLLATDIAEQPLEIARKRLGNHSHVTFHQTAAHTEWPTGEFDLIVLSEVGYYFSVDALNDLVCRAAESLTPGGVLVACHWRHPVSDYPLTGDQVHARLRAEPSLERFVHHSEEDFLLELFSPRPALSVARQTGLV
ncbi:bifunctional PIG-L family deacetylase/class I SAM-dependent methyltransferase [Salinibacterium sp. TMP30]|uniref:bifunctional PIG-L family deacetylase/class I SAM-dependent methyltransferase n=1 Tax=Salinibacterium sp. TMP30 TaxID=3138237 RepID=UPI003138AD2D